MAIADISAAPRRVAYLPWLLALLVLLLALVPRTLGLADFYTIDEAYHWPDRVRRFTQALQSQQWIRTDQTGHPGVTTMWLGSLGRWLGEQRNIYDDGRIGNGAAYLGALRLPLAVANSLAVAIGFLLLRRLVRLRLALLAVFLWATAPFVVAYSRLLHLDGLLTSFMTLCVLSMLVALGAGRAHAAAGNIEQEHKTESERPVLSSAQRVSKRGTELAEVGARSFSRPMFLLAAFFGGLALLTKAPSLLLLPSIGLLMFAWSPVPGFVGRLRWSVPRYLVWLALAVALVFAGWPAMWVDPRAAAGDVLNEIIANGGQPTDTGNFFMGRPVPVPGLWFYPAAVLLRTDPATLIGLALALGAGLLALVRRRAPNAEGRVLLSLLGFALLFALAMDIEAKQFDRYLLPIWPSLAVLAAAGWWHAWDALAALLGRARRLAGAALLLCVAALQIGQLWWYHPYELGYYNALLGGGATAQRVILVGWGEGLEEAGAWLSARPDLRRGPIQSWIPYVLEPFVPSDIPVNDLQPPRPGVFANYAVLYIRSVQRKESAAAEAYVRQFPPLLTIQKYGITYATVHQLPRPFALPVDAVFGAGLRLRGVTLARDGATLTVTPSWGVEASQAGGAFTFVHVLAPDGQKVGQLDIPLDQGLFPQWQAGQQFDGPIPIALPATLAPGEYRVVMGVYRPGENGRLPVQGVTPLPDAVDGPSVVQVATFTQP